MSVPGEPHPRFKLALKGSHVLWGVLFYALLLPGLAITLRHIPISQRTTLDNSAIEHLEGNCYVYSTALPGGDSNEFPYHSRLRLYENNKRLGPSHNTHKDIIQNGEGGFSHWHDAVYFSTEDNTDPRVNGRKYAIKHPLNVSRWWGIGLLGLAVLLLPRHVRHVTDLYENSEVPRNFVDRPRQILSVIVLVLLASVVISRMGVCSPISQERRLNPKEIRPVKGNCYSVYCKFLGGDSPENPSRSLLRVYENGVELQGSHCVHESIATQGQGRFSHWGQMLFFSATDNTDPVTNGRDYVLKGPWLPSLSTVYWLLGGLLILNLSRLPGFWSKFQSLSTSTHCIWILIIAAFYCGMLAIQHWNSVIPNSIKGLPFNDANGWMVFSEEFSVGERWDYVWDGWGLRRPFHYVFTGSVLAVTGPSIDVVRGLHLFMLIAAAGLRLDLLRRIVPFPVALAVSVMAVFQLDTITLALTTLSETLGNFLNVLSLWTLVWATQRAGHRAEQEQSSEQSTSLLQITWPFVLSGMFFSLANLTRTLTLASLSTIPVVLVLLAFRFPKVSGRWKHAWRCSLGFVVGAVLALAPWVIRNKVIYDVVCITDNSAEMLYAATTPQYGTWEPEVSQLGANAKNLTEKYRIYKAGISENLKNHTWWYVGHVTEDLYKGLHNFAPPRSLLWALLVLFVLQSVQTTGLRKQFHPRSLLVYASVCGLLLYAPATWIAFSVLIAMLGSILLRHPVSILSAVLGASWGALALIACNRDPRLSSSLFWISHAIVGWGFLSLLSVMYSGSGTEVNSWFNKENVVTDKPSRLGRGAIYLATGFLLLWGTGLGLAVYRNMTAGERPPIELSKSESERWLATFFTRAEAEPYREIRDSLDVLPIYHLRSKTVAVKEGEIIDFGYNAFGRTAVPSTIFYGSNKSGSYFYFPGDFRFHHDNCLVIGTRLHGLRFEVIGIVDGGVNQPVESLKLPPMEYVEKHVRFIQKRLEENRLKQDQK